MIAQSAYYTHTSGTECESDEPTSSDIHYGSRVEHEREREKREMGQPECIKTIAAEKQKSLDETRQTGETIPMAIFTTCFSHSITRRTV